MREIKYLIAGLRNMELNTCTEAADQLEMLLGAARRSRTAIQDMMAEFRALDLPYGSKAYAQANDISHELRVILGDLI